MIVSHHRNGISIADIKASSPALSIGKRSLDLINKASNELWVVVFFFLLFLASSCCLVFHASDLPFLCVSSCRVTERAVFLSSRHTGNVAVKNKLSHLFHALQKPQWLNIGVSNDQNKLLKQWCLVIFFFFIQTTERRANRVSRTR